MLPAVVGTRFCVSVENPAGQDLSKRFSVEEGLVRFKTRSGKMFVEAGKSTEVIGEQFQPRKEM